VDRHAVELGHLLLGEDLERGAADDHSVALDHDEAIELHLEALAAAPDEDALVLHRAEQRRERTDVL
jgi:hypothetical protein